MSRFVDRDCFFSLLSLEPLLPDAQLINAGHARIAIYIYVCVCVCVCGHNRIKMIYKIYTTTITQKDCGNQLVFDVFFKILKKKTSFCLRSALLSLSLYIYIYIYIYKCMYICIFEEIRYASK